MKTCFFTLGAMAVAISISSAEENTERAKPQPEALFAKLDADSSGTVSLEEFKQSPKGKKDPEKAAKAFAKIDADSSGDVTLEEFKAGGPGPGKGKGKGKGGEGAPPAAE